MGFLGIIFVIITLLTVGLPLVIFLAAFTRLWKTPPVIRIELNTPPETKLILQHMPALAETEKSVEVAIPEDILKYIELESDSWAREARKKNARRLYADCGKWELVFQLLRQEDGEE